MPRRFNVAGPCKPEIHYIFDRRAGQPPIAQRTAAQQAMTPGACTATVIRA